MASWPRSAASLESWAQIRLTLRSVIDRCGRYPPPLCARSPRGTPQTASPVLVLGLLGIASYSPRRFGPVELYRSRYFRTGSVQSSRIFRQPQGHQESRKAGLHTPNRNVGCGENVTAYPETRIVSKGSCPACRRSKLQRPETFYCHGIRANRYQHGFAKKCFAPGDRESTEERSSALHEARLRKKRFGRVRPTIKETFSSDSAK